MGIVNADYAFSIVDDTPLFVSDDGLPGVSLLANQCHLVLMIVANATFDRPLTDTEAAEYARVMEIITLLLVEV